MSKLIETEEWIPVIAGTKFIPPRWAKYASRQPDGTWYWFENPPILSLEGPRNEHGWYASEGKASPVLKNSPTNWIDSLVTDPFLLGKNEDERKSRIIKNATARYTAALGKLVVVYNNQLIGIPESDAVTWGKLINTTWFEIIETPDDEYLRYKDGKSAPYWRALPCEHFTWQRSTFRQSSGIEKNVWQDSYVLIRPPRETIDGTTPPWSETSFSLGLDYIVEPSTVRDERIPLYRKRHPDTRYDQLQDDRLDINHVYISEIKWDSN